MDWVRIRSRRDPAFWAPLLAVLVLAVLAALGLQQWTAGWTSHLESLRRSDPRAAVETARPVLRMLAWAVCIVCLATAALLFRFFQLSGREERLPPSGWWSLGAYRAMVGPGARRASRIGVALCALVAAAGIGFLIQMTRLLAAVQPG